MEWNPIKIIENSAEKSALKKVINQKIAEFEENLSYAKIDWHKPSHERFMGMKEDELIALRQAVGCLGEYMDEIISNFKLSTEKQKIVESIKKYAEDVSELANLNEMKQIFKERDINRYKSEVEPYLIEPNASRLNHTMHMLYVNIHDLKKS